MEIKSPEGNTYVVGNFLGNTDKYNLYSCTYGKGQEAILKIASAIKHNGILDKEAYLLGLMHDAAIDTEEEYSKIKKGDAFLNYQFCFPQVIESFVSPEQKNRYVLVLGFSEICTHISELAALSLITDQDRVRVDPRTSAWMLGKLLKLLVFTHGLGISMNLRTPWDDILINREQHYVAIFEWSEARLENGQLSADAAAEEISQFAQEIIIVLGGDPDTGEIPADEQLTDTRYADFLKRLSDKKENNAKKAHTEFYDLIWSLWPHEFHKYTTYRLS